MSASANYIVDHYGDAELECFIRMCQAEKNMTIIYSFLHTVKSSCTNYYFILDFKIVHLKTHKERTSFFNMLYLSSTLKLLKVYNFGI